MAYPQAEWAKAGDILMHTPGQELFNGVIHPTAGLFENYFDVDKAYSFLTEKADSLNEYARRFFRDTADRITVTFMTPTEYRKGPEQ